MLRSKDKRMFVVHMPDENTPGFRGAWCMMDATKKNLQEALGKKLFDAEMKALGGRSALAGWVKELR